MPASDFKYAAKGTTNVDAKVFSVIFVGFALFLSVNLGCAAKTAKEDPRYWSTVMQENSIGHIAAAGKALRGRVITFEPGAVARFHEHKVPGVRYVLEGVVTVKWKNGTSKTYTAGETFFEGPIGNMSARAHEVSNEGSSVAKIWNVELIPEMDMKK